MIRKMGEIASLILLGLISCVGTCLALDEDQAIRQVLRATVQIIVRSSTPSVPADTGSGVIVSPQGFILTAKHVLKEYFRSPETTNVFVRLLDNNLILGPEKRAEFISPDPTNVDMALIRLIGDNLPFLKVGSSSLVTMDESLVAVGFVGGGENWLTKSGRRNGLTWEVDIPLFPGSSGGPVVKRGCDVLVGIVSGGLEDAQTRTLIPGRSVIVPSQFGAFLLARAEATHSPNLCQDSRVHETVDHVTSTSSQPACKEISVAETINGISIWRKKCL